VLKFLSSPGFPGLGFGTVLLMLRIGCQGFTEPNLFTLLNKNQTPCDRKEYLICGGKGKKDFYKNKKIMFCSVYPVVLCIFFVALCVTNFQAPNPSKGAKITSMKGRSVIK
jgi:hypothetical protein